MKFSSERKSHSRTCQRGLVESRSCQKHLIWGYGFLLIKVNAQILQNISDKISHDESSRAGRVKDWRKKKKVLSRKSSKWCLGYRRPPIVFLTHSWCYHERCHKKYGLSEYEHVCFKIFCMLPEGRVSLADRRFSGTKLSGGVRVGGGAEHGVASQPSPRLNFMVREGAHYCWHHSLLLTARYLLIQPSKQYFNSKSTLLAAGSKGL